MYIYINSYNYANLNEVWGENHKESHFGCPQHVKVDASRFPVPCHWQFWAKGGSVPLSKMWDAEDGLFVSGVMVPNDFLPRV